MDGWMDGWVGGWVGRHTKTHPNEILNTQLNFKTHTFLDSTLYHRNTPSQATEQVAPRPTTTSSEDDPQIGRNMSTRKPTEWPARSPDLTACDYWFLGYLKKKVYARKPQHIDMLKIAIEEEIHAIPMDMYHKSMNDFPKRCQLSLDVNGEQFEAIK
ncbi:hypothetical protein ANN_09263 [Periplaneta americana]|uniref:Uncharacterized protein n=1 Tax=Periplaneta americana TaxID=6978 RepID=A0ABQ8TNR7_PERAM|nr:hypothetical protein ANN_09263 [Periplaneta americana]